ncbi:type IV pilin protein [Pseudoalteromonas sp. S16_S37]|uniref:type IV pilin protein n=1 Tax=Pseudoalteromonas sp. S16_S37 TaxID=2720228 RepID=UPI00167FEBC8|nr:type IV pilin protein [Pseudoalteromonas sp. S16_S37]MBD1584285.1 type IV pilin protein [Pseudoalteromonas sp. S16_S37]
MKHQGFSLLELLIASAIVAILGVLAYPTYLGAVQEGVRSEAQQELLKTAVILERLYSRNGGYPDSDKFDALPTLEHYTFKYEHKNKPDGGANYTSREFLLTATPKATSMQASDHCGELTIDHIGTQGAAENGCW